jgi:hypothetical protein
MSKTLTKTRARSALAALLLCSAAAQAATFSLSGSTDDLGPLPSAAFSGLFSYSDIGLPADGEVSLTDFSLNFAGQSYTLASATATPTAVFAGGSFIGLSYVDDASVDTALRPQISFTPGFFALPEAYLSYVGSEGLSGFGSYSISSVPEPATLALWLGGLALLGAVRARRR